MIEMNFNNVKQTKVMLNILDYPSLNPVCITDVSIYVECDQNDQTPNDLDLDPCSKWQMFFSLNVSHKGFPKCKSQFMHTM